MEKRIWGTLGTWASGILSVVSGGTGAATLTDGGLLVGAGTSPIEALPVGATTEILVGNGPGNNPLWTTATGSGAPVRTTSPVINAGISKGPAIISSFAGTVGTGGVSDATVVFSSAADAILAGYDATNPILGTTLITAGPFTRYIVSWNSSTSCEVDSVVTLANGTAITSVQLPIATFVNSAGVLIGYILTSGQLWLPNPATIQLGSASVDGRINFRDAGSNVWIANSANTMTVGGYTSVVLNSNAILWSFIGASLTLPDAGKILYDVDLATDHTCTGETFSATAGENLVFGNLCYLKSDGKWWKTDSDAASTMPGTAIATGTINADATGIFLLEGYARDDSAWAGLTIGGTLYASQTGGAITQTAPVPAANVQTTTQVQILGKAPSTNTATVGIIRFYPETIVTEAMNDIVDFGTTTSNTITVANLTAVPITFMANHTDPQTIAFDAAFTAADIGKRFTIMKNGTGNGTVIMDMYAGMTAAGAGATTSAGGTVTLPTAALGSMTFVITSATTCQLVCADGSLTWA